MVFAPSASAQLASQTALVGTVTDSGGGVLPGATVVAVNTGTKDTYEATTNAQGQYNIQFVRPGRYDITVSMQGFQASRTTGIELTTNQVVRTNAVLQVGAVSEEVLVEARAAVLATDRATVSDTINAQQLTELPSRGRNVWQMAEITPGVQRGTRGGHVDRRGAARHPEQPDARRHQLGGQPDAVDLDAADRRRGR